MAVVAVAGVTPVVAAVVIHMLVAAVAPTMEWVSNQTDLSNSNSGHGYVTIDLQ